MQISKIILLFWLIPPIVLCGCEKEQTLEGMTGVRVTVRYRPPLELQQLTFVGATQEIQFFGPTTLPASPGELDPAEESVVILVESSNSGQVVRVKVDGLLNGQVVASGLGEVELHYQQIQDLWIDLGEAARCGDGSISDHAEECDDVNVVNHDGCSAHCLLETGWYCAGEPSDCDEVPCGDGIIQPGQECDDGNLDGQDGCSDLCMVESGWVCGGEPSTCAQGTCGDGVIEAAEECDDGDTQGADGCSGICTVELGWVCSEQPSVCSEVSCPDEDDDGICDSDDQCPGFDDLADVDGDGTADGCDPCSIDGPNASGVPLPASGSGITIREASINGGSNVVLVNAGESFTLDLSFDISDCICPTCRDQIEVGFVPGPGVDYCAYDGMPGCSGDSGSNSTTMVAPDTPGEYKIRFGLRQDYGCGLNWWHGEPPEVRTLGALCVQ